MDRAYYLPGPSLYGKKDESDCPAQAVCASNNIEVHGQDTVYCRAPAACDKRE